jgi:hypothetical protein
MDCRQAARVASEQKGLEVHGSSPWSAQKISSGSRCTLAPETPSR